MAPSVTDTPGYNEQKALATLERLVSTTAGVMVVQYTQNDVKRVVSIDEDNESVEPAGDDPLGEVLCDGLERLSHTERVGSYEVSVDPLGSLAVLFDKSPEARALKPRLIAGYDMRNDAQLVAACIVCLWSRQEYLSTQRFTAQWLSDNDLPAFNSQWLLVDSVCSSQPGAATLVLLHAYLLCMRSKMRGVVAVCVTRKGRDVFVKQGYESFDYRESGRPQTLAWIKAGDLSMEELTSRLRVGGGRTTLEQLCFRMGLTPRSASSLVGRCPR